MKRDANEREIVEALRAAGHLVQHLDQGAGVPDLIVLAGGRLVLLEVKDGPKKKLTPAQVKWHAQWAGAPLFVVDSVDAALAAVADIDPQVKRVRELEAMLDRWESFGVVAMGVSPEHDIVTSTRRLLGMVTT